MELLDQEKVMQVLDSIYGQVVDGIGKVSKPVGEMADDYMSKYPNKEIAVKKMLRNQVTKCTVTGVMSGLGGAITLPAAVSADIASVLYVQMRMIAATAHMCGYKLNSDQTQTFVYACLAGVSIDKVLSDAGIKFGTKFTEVMIKRIPGETLKNINQKVGFQFITKFGERGVINLGRMIPAVGGLVGGGFNLIETRIIANRAYKTFYKDDLAAFSGDDIETVEEAQTLDDDIEMI